MAVKDFGRWDSGRWLIATNGSGWGLCSPECVEEWTFENFAEAHAAYLDAVTCEAQTPFPNYTEPRCYRSRGHEGPHRFTGLNGTTTLEQMPK